MSKKAIVDFIPVQGVAYVGPGDVVASAYAWWGLRGYSAAYSTGSNPAIDVVDTATGLITTTINILSSGNLDEATVLGLGYGVSVKKMYDQSGNGRHVSQATLAAMPVLTASVLGSLPAMKFLGSSSQYLETSSGLAPSYPITISAVGERTGAFTSYGDLVAARQTGGAFTPQVGFNNATNQMFSYGGVINSGTAADSAFHAVQCVLLGGSTSSDLYIDGSSNTGNDGGAGMSGFSIGGNNFLTGYATEAGVWLSAFASGDKSSMNSNQHTYWGF